MSNSKVRKYILINAFLTLSITFSLHAQPSISLWKVDQAHINDHTQGESYLLDCGSEYYVNYKGAGTSEDIIIDILNEGDQDLALILPLTLSAESSAAFSIIHQPNKAILKSGEEAHFVIKYSASAEYENATAQVSITSNDFNNEECSLMFEVGSEVACENCPTFTQAFLPNSIGPYSTTTLEYTINNTAGGAVNVTDLQFTDNLSPGILIADPARASTDCTDGAVVANAGGNSISFSNARLSAGASCKIRVDVTSSTIGSIYNLSSNLESSAGTGPFSEATLTIDGGKVGIVKSFSPSSIPPGGVSELKIEMKNEVGTEIPDFSSSNLEVIVDDILPSGMSFATPLVVSNNCISATLTATSNDVNNIINFDGTIPTSDCSLTVNVTAANAGTYVNTAVEEDFGYTSSAELEVVSDFLVKSFSDDPVVPGGQVTLDFTIQNPSRSSAASAIAFTDDLNGTLSGLVATGLPMNNVCGTGSLISGTNILAFSGGSLPAEGSCTFSVLLDVPAGAAQGSYTNTTSAITASIDGNGVTGNTATDILVVSEAPILTKSFMTNPIVSGQDVVLNFNLMNPSASQATEISFTDEFNVIFKTASPPLMNTSFCNSSGSSTFTPLNNLPAKLEVSGIMLLPGASCSFSITLNSDANAPGGVYNNTTSSVTATIGSSAVVGSPASDDITVVDPPRIKKDFEPSIVRAGAMTSLKFEITHDANATFDATSISFTDDLDAALSGLVAAGLPLNDVCGAGSMISGTSTLSFTGGSLTPGVLVVFFLCLYLSL